MLLRLSPLVLAIAVASAAAPHWAFQPLRTTGPPTVAGVENAVDLSFAQALPRKESSLRLPPTNAPSCAARLMI